MNVRNTREPEEDAIIAEEPKEPPAPKRGPTPNNLEIISIIWKSMLGITLLMISRVTVFTILTHVPAVNVAQDVFSQRLVYVNLAGDLLGRLLTVILPLLPEKRASLIILVIILIHFSCLDVVLLYVYGHGIISPNDIVSQVFLAIFASFTGYLQTQSYVYAAVGVDPLFKTQVGALMNLATQTGNFGGLLMSFMLRYVFH